MNHKQPTSTAVKTAEEIYIECLEQYIMGNSEINKVCSTQRQLSVYAMKLYANAKLDEAAEKAKLKAIPNIEGGYLKMVDTESILSLKEFI